MTQPENVLTLPVTPLDPFAPLVPVDQQEPDKRVCAHLHVEYSVRERTLRCRDCDELADPFDWLVAFAEREARSRKWAIEVEKRKQEKRDRARLRRTGFCRHCQTGGGRHEAGCTRPRQEQLS